MSSVTVFDPGVFDQSGTPSPNLGDLIIAEAVDRELRSLFAGRGIVRVSTHAPMTSAQRRQVRRCPVVIVGGSNLLSSHMHAYRQWNLSVYDAACISKAILFGVGWWQYQGPPGRYARLLMRLALSSKALHSVRDNYTLEQVRRLGVHNVVNTGCPTMWPLAKVGPESIPCAKARVVLATVTDYAKQPESDLLLLRALAECYDEVYVWPQGKEDAAYVQQLGCPVRMLDHSLGSFLEFITKGSPIDYVGTRLHAGIRCLVAKHRALILAVDNRATEIARDTGLPTVARTDMKCIRHWIQFPAATCIRMDHESIRRWRDQFVGAVGQ